MLPDSLTNLIIATYLEQWFLTFFTYFTPFETRLPKLPHYTQWCSFIKTTKLTNFYSSKLFIQFYSCCNSWFRKFASLEDEIYSQSAPHLDAGP